MLQYGDTSIPLLKSFPTIGLKEIFYNTTTQLFEFNFVSLQS